MTPRNDRDSHGDVAALEAQLAAILRSTSDAVVGKTVDGVITAWNAAAERLYGYRADEVIGRRIEVIIPPARLDEEQIITSKVIAGETVAPYTTQRVRKDGSLIQISLTVSPIRDAAGSIVGASAIARDVTAEQRAEAKFAGLLEAAPDAIIVVDEDGLIRIVNRQTEALFGYGRDELIGRPIEMLVPMHARPQHPDLRGGFVAHPAARPMGAGLELTGRRKNGVEFPVDISLAPLETDEGVLVSAAIRDTTERVRVQEMLRRAAEEAERANAAKSDFLSRMSHELRTPLAAILGFAELIHLGRAKADQIPQFVDRILRAGHHLLDLINDVLDISRVESGMLLVSIEPVNAAALVADAAELVQPIAQSNEVALVIGEGPIGAMVYADVSRMKQVLLNLLSNAVKYNRRGGRVEVGWEVVEDEWLRISVTDTGLGIAAEFTDRLFHPFERLGAESLGVEGTGIGLALSKRLVELMGGSLGYSTIVGEGSTFWAELPLAAPDVPLSRRAHDPDLTESDLGRGRTVLYIEDNLSNYLVVEGVLELRPGLRLLTALQGRLGLDLAREHQPDLILLDLNLPDLPGDQVLAMLRSDPKTAEIPVLVISADAMPERISAVLKAGAVGYLAKPINVQDFLDAVDGLLTPEG